MKLYKVVNENRESYVFPIISKYCLIYKKGKIINTLPGTMGIFCFLTEENALKFMGRWNAEIIKVEAIGEAKDVTSVAAYCSDEALDVFYKGRKTVPMIPPPLGTVLCQKIKVLN